MGEVMLRWVRDILRPYTQRRPALLVMDSFTAHITSKVKAELAKINTHLAIILGGCMSKAQPLDVTLNKPFKDRIRRQWTEFMQTRQEEDLQTDTGKTGREHTGNELIKWMNVAQKDIASTLVTKSFKVTGISNPPPYKSFEKTYMMHTLKHRLRPVCAIRSLIEAFGICFVFV